MEFLVKHAEGILAVDWMTLLVIAALCGLACYFIKDYMANPPMIVFVYPVLVFFSVVANYAITLQQTYNPKKLDEWLMWTIMAAIAGTMVGTCLVAALAGLRERLIGRHPRQAKPAR